MVARGGLRFDIRTPGGTEIVGGFDSRPIARRSLHRGSGGSQGGEAWGSWSWLIGL